jgi:hypothetical protein
MRRGISRLCPLTKSVGKERKPIRLMDALAADRIRQKFENMWGASYSVSLLAETRLTFYFCKRIDRQVGYLGIRDRQVSEFED